MAIAVAWVCLSLPSAWVTTLLTLCIGYAAGRWRLASWAQYLLSGILSRNGGYVHLSHSFLNLEETTSWMNLGLWRPTAVPVLRTAVMGSSTAREQRASSPELTIHTVTPATTTAGGCDDHDSSGDAIAPPSSPSYAAACAALATALGVAADLTATDAVLDVGFGRGDQLFLWRDHFRVRHVQGLNSSVLEVRHFQRRWRRRQQHEQQRQQQKKHKEELQARGQHADAGVEPVGTIDSAVGSATLLPAQLNERFDKVLALDCAYHFAPSREVFFHQAFAALKAGGR
jgi:hypothetical protein